MENIIIGGIKHSGKTLIGHLLAERLQINFMDMDEVMLRNQHEKTIRELWKNRGETTFRHMEAQAARKITRTIRRNGETTILSLGGGTIENPPAMASLKQIKGTRIYLRADEEMLYKRIMAKGHPPFLGQQTPREDFSRLYRTRDPLYTQFANLIHTVNDIAPEENTRKILAALENYHARK